MDRCMGHSGFAGGLRTARNRRADHALVAAVNGHVSAGATSRKSQIRGKMSATMHRQPPTPTARQHCWWAPKLEPHCLAEGNLENLNADGCSARAHMRGIRALCQGPRDPPIRCCTGLCQSLAQGFKQHSASSWWRPFLLR